MLRGLLKKDRYKAQFSGHETFPLHQLWLRKAYDAVEGFKGHAPRTVFADPDAIARFGVGKNMVSAIRHWALACDVIEEVGDGYFGHGRLGKELFGPSCLDPYLEHPASAWLIHWHLAGEGRRSTTWYWLFNHVHGPIFEKEEVLAALMAYCEETGKGRASKSTLARDLDACLRSYSPRTGNTLIEEVVEPVLAELGLISALRGTEYMFRIGAKPHLPDAVLLFALTRFWSHFAATSNAMNLDVLAYEPSGIGQTFKLDFESLALRLATIEDASRGAYVWSETAGLKQVIRNRESIDEFTFLREAYKTSPKNRVGA